MIGRAHRNGNGRVTSTAAAVDPAVTIRRLADADRSALRRLAELDTSRAPAGTVVGAERDGQLLAAISLTSGDVVADPFHPTAELVALLRLRAGQLLPAA